MLLAMSLGKQKTTSAPRQCPLRSDCREKADKAYFSGLFDKDWEVFVVKRNPEKKAFDWFTLCCEETGDVGGMCR
jgi:hypothetical protein